MQRTQSGFTLLEILVSSVILAAIVVLLFGMVNGASQLWKHGEQNREAVREARAGIEMITEDLHAAVITTNPASFLIRENNKDGNTSTGSSIFLLISHPSEKRGTTNGGDLCAVGYFVDREKTGDQVFNLYRFHTSGKVVSQALEKGTLQALYATASPENTATTELLARHILELDIHCISASTDAPALLELVLSSLNGETARLVASDDKSKERNERLLKQHLHRYSTVIALPPERINNPSSQ